MARACERPRGELLRFPGESRDYRPPPAITLALRRLADGARDPRLTGQALDWIRTWAPPGAHAADILDDLLLALAHERPRSRGTGAPTLKVLVAATGAASP